MHYKTVLDWDRCPTDRVSNVDFNPTIFISDLDIQSHECYDHDSKGQCQKSLS